MIILVDGAEGRNAIAARGKHNTYLHDAQNPGSLSWSFQRIVSPDRNGTNLPPANGYASGGVHVSRFSTTLSLLRGNP